RSGVAYGDGTTAQGGIVPLLHRGEEGVHVHMDDLARRSDVHKPRLAEREQSWNILLARNRPRHECPSPMQPSPYPARRSPTAARRVQGLRTTLVHSLGLSWKFL